LSTASPATKALEKAALPPYKQHVINFFFLTGSSLGMPKDNVHPPTDADILAQTLLQDDHALLRQTLLEAESLRIGNDSRDAANRATVWFKPPGSEMHGKQLQQLRQTPSVKGAFRSKNPSKKGFILLVMRVPEKAMNEALKLVRRNLRRTEGGSSAPLSFTRDENLLQPKQAVCR
jgi:hypothetical protein